MPDAELEGLRDALRRELGREVALHRLGFSPPRPLFRMTDEEGGGESFVKIGDGARLRRAWSFLSSTDLPFVPRGRFLFDWDGRSVLGMEWREGRMVPPERMSAAQCADLVRAHEAVLRALRGAEALSLPDVRPLYETVAAFARRHPLAAPLLRALLAIPAGLRVHDPATATVVISDFHFRNYAFDGERIAAFYDFDRLRLGSPAEDLAYAIVRRCRKGTLTRAERRNVRERFRQMVRESSFPAREWRRAVDIHRLDIAAKRLASHPDCALVALDVWRRDRPLALLELEVRS